MMVELLLVVVLAVILLYLGLLRYRAFHQRMQFDLIYDDMITIRQTLNRYYNKLPCDKKGTLLTSLDADIINQLDTIKRRSPYVDQYHAYLHHDSGAVTKTKKPIYQLEVSADINASYRPLVKWLSERLRGTRYSQKTIDWVSLPNTLVVQPRRILWVLNVSRQRFKNLKNKTDLATKQGSHSYCFR